MTGVQLFNSDPNHEFIQMYNVLGIPHFILLDQEGNIINSHTKRPSDPDLIPLIESYL
ncbi:MAG: hypothetical protein GQ574_00915 [Crocinitomix sp.]|nr:hypothetical protein [Crocinitomix sp.]